MDKSVSTKLSGALFTALAIVATVFAQTPSTTWYTSNPAADTFYISTADELAGLAKIVNDGISEFSQKRVVLTDNIDLSVYGQSFNGGKGWIPIGGITLNENSENSMYPYTFSGTFDGNGKTISRLYINDSTRENVGLVGSMGDGAIVKNLGVVDIEIYGFNNVGGVVGYNGYVLDSYSTGAISGAKNVGGVVGHGCVYSSYSTSAINGTENVGGVVGYGRVKVPSTDGEKESSSAYNSYSTGTIIGVKNVGGVMGFGRVHSCYSTGAVTGIENIGGVVGFARWVFYSYSISTVSGVKNVGGVAGTSDFANDEMVYKCAALNPSVQGDTAVGRVAGSALASYSVAYANMDGVFTSVNGNGANISNGVINNMDSRIGVLSENDEIWTTENGKLPGFFGKAVDMPEHLKYTTPLLWYTGKQSPYVISDLSELLELAALVNDGTDNFNGKTVVLAADIDLSHYLNGGKGWIPIGNIDTKNAQFSGIFDGAGHIISGLSISDSTLKSAGLFGYVSGGTVKNIGDLASFNIGGGDNAGAFAGALSDGAVLSNCKIVRGDGIIRGNSYIGGLAGSVSSGSSISDCDIISLWSVAGNSFIGGLVGSVNGGSSIRDCRVSYIHTPIEGDRYVGGVAGAVSDSSSINSCGYSVYNRYNNSPGERAGTVRGNEYIGGVAGQILSANVIDCYSTGVVKGNIHIGGVAGNVTGGRVTNSYAIGLIYGSDGYNNIGGVVGSVQADGNHPGSVLNCAALNYSVSGEKDDTPADPVLHIGRVAGYLEEGAEFSGNIAFAGIIGDFDDPDSAAGYTLVTVEEIHADSTLNGIFSDASTWTTKIDWLPGLFGEPVEMPTHLGGTWNISVASTDRVIPQGKPGEVVVVAPVGRFAGEFTVGPNPVGRGSGAVSFFRLGGGIKGGALVIYDASGSLVRKVKIVDKTAIGNNGKRVVGSWDLRDAKGRPVAVGTYLVKGKITASGGKVERVSAVVGVR